MDFHDATLLSVQADWVDGTALVLLRVADEEEPVKVRASGVTDLRLPRQHPWGASLSVNSLRVADHVLSIEMQSGDTIAIAATSFEVPAT